MEINQNLQNLYAAKQKQQAYKDYKAAAKKGEETEELFAKADVNGDGKITKADQKAAKKEISTLTNSKKTPNLFDMDGDEKVNIKDLLALNTLDDIDGDGVLSDAEKAFIAEQEKALIKKLEKQKDKKEYDFNQDGAYNLYDVQAFLDLTNDRDIYHSDDATDKYLVKVLEKMNKKFCLSMWPDRYYTSTEMVMKDMLIQKAVLEDFLNNKEVDYYSSNHSKLINARAVDIDNNGILNQKDVELLEIGISSISKQLGLSMSENAVNEKKAAYEQAKINEANAKKAYKNASKDEKKALKKAYDFAKQETKRTKTEYANNAKYHDGINIDNKKFNLEFGYKEFQNSTNLKKLGLPATKMSLNGVQKQSIKLEGMHLMPQIEFNSTTNNEDLTVKEPIIETPPLDNNENAQDNENVTLNNNTENNVQEEQTEPKKEYKIPNKIRNLAAKHAPNLSEEEIYKIYKKASDSTPKMFRNSSAFNKVITKLLKAAEKEKVQN